MVEGEGRGLRVEGLDGRNNEIKSRIDGSKDLQNSNGVDLDG